MAVSKKTTDTVVPPVPPVDPVVPTAPTPDVNAGVDPAALPQDGDVFVTNTLSPEPTLTPDEITINQAAADAAFNAANDGAEERVAKEKAIPSMTPEELQAEFGWTVGEAISVLRDAISRSRSIHVDKMNDHLDKIEATSQL